MVGDISLFITTIAIDIYNLTITTSYLYIIWLRETLSIAFGPLKSMLITNYKSRNVENQMVNRKYLILEQILKLLFNHLEEKGHVKIFLERLSKAKFKEVAEI